MAEQQKDNNDRKRQQQRVEEIFDQNKTVRSYNSVLG